MFGYSLKLFGHLFSLPPDFLKLLMYGFRAEDARGEDEEKYQRRRSANGDKAYRVQNLFYKLEHILIHRLPPQLKTKLVIPERLSHLG